jgi:hypothetical protein
MQATVMTSSQVFEAERLYSQADELEQAAKSWNYVNGPHRDVAGNLLDAAEALRKAARLIRRG